MQCATIVGPAMICNLKKTDGNEVGNFDFTAFCCIYFRSQFFQRKAWRGNIDVKSIH